MNPPISPWQPNDVELKSPSGKFTAKLTNPAEIAMGGPTSGCLSIDSLVKIENCNPSMVWSSDSKYLAVPQWTKNRNQKLLVIDVETKQSYASHREFRVLELHEFNEGMISGIDSPVHKPLKFSIDIQRVIHGSTLLDL